MIVAMIQQSVSKAAITQKSTHWRHHRVLASILDQDEMLLYAGTIHADALKNRA